MYIMLVFLKILNLVRYNTSETQLRIGCPFAMSIQACLLHSPPVIFFEKV